MRSTTAEAKKREHTRNELNYKEWLVRESLQVTERRKYDFHEKHQHANCICQHDFRPSWWQRIVGLLEWDVLPLKAVMARERPSALGQHVISNVATDPYNDANGIDATAQPMLRGGEGIRGADNIHDALLERDEFWSNMLFNTKHRHGA
ncbi:hypothetical protein Slin14017_G050260 [Septoria linicola]|nr:hypothetical protein Slin14017_G050260 [Septoria linicola]